MTVSKQRKSGIIFALSSYMLWGILPIYWKQLDRFDSLYLLSARIAGFFVLLVAIVLITGQTKNVIASFKDRRKLTYGSLAGVAVALNWWFYILCVNSGHILESSLGYYINPLFVIVASSLLFREKIKKLQKISIATAAFAVFLLIVSAGVFPAYALILATTFTLYGVFKLKSGDEALNALFIETAVSAPFAIAYIVYAHANGLTNASMFDAKSVVFLLLAGAVTGLPLYFYTEATRRAPFSWVGICQYLSPTLQFLIGVIIYGEPFAFINGIVFGLIWISVALFVAEGFRRNKRIET